MSGGNITWTCNGGNTYLLSLTLYRDCDGISMPNTINTNLSANPSFTSSSLSISNSCGLNPTFTGLTTLTLISNTEVSQLCPPQLAQSECSGGTLPGMEEYVYQTEITLPDCDCWTFSYTLCCRNNAITNLANPASDYSTIQSTLCNATGPSCNNSPDFTAQPIPYICNNVPFCYDYGVVEPDGNTLSYSFTSALNSGNPSGYAAGYNANSPIPGITIDPLTGQICFTPTTNGNFVVTIMLTETDAAGNVIGTYMQDIQFVIMNCPNIPPSSPNNITNVTGSGTVTGNTSIQLCENDDFCAEVVFTDADAGDIVTLSSNLAAVLPGSTITINNGSPASATICWTENLGGPAFYSFSVDAIDDACPIPGINSFTVDVTVLSSTDPACFNCSLTASILSQDNLNCNGASNGSLTVTQSSGTPGYQYSIDAGATWQNSPTFNGLSAGNYTITIEDATPCQATVSTTITEPTALTVTLDNSIDVSCNGANDGTISVVASNGTPSYEFSIDGGLFFQNSGTFTGLSPGTNYNITVQDVNFCTVTIGPFTINEPALIIADLISEADQCLSVNSFDFDATGSTDPQSISTSPNLPQYIWDFGDGNTACGGFCAGLNADAKTHVYTTAGTYTVTVTVTDGTCSDVASIIINVNDEPTGSVVASNVNCNGICDGSLDLTVSNGTAPYSYIWDNGAGNTEDPNSLCANTYNVTITDDNGCTTTASGTITEPTLLIGTVSSTTDASCGFANGSFTVQAVDGTPGYQYSIDGGTTWQSTGLFPNVFPGIYLVNIEDVNNCGTTLNVVINDLSGITASISSQTEVSCNGFNDGDVTVIASGSTGPYQYSIDGGTTWQATGLFSALAAGNYTVVSEDANGCQFPVTVLITEPTLLTGTFDNSNPVNCNAGNDGNFTVSAAGGTSSYQYSIDGGVTFQSTGDFSALNAGNYTITIEDANDCQATVIATVTEPTSVSVSISNTANVTCNGLNDGSLTAVGLGGTPNYQYSIDGGITFQNTGDFTGLTAGNYVIIIEDDNDCQSTVAGTVTEPTLLSGTINTTTDATCGLANGSFTVQGLDGTPGYQYSTDGGATWQASGIFPGVMPGNYLVDIKDVNNCGFTLNVVINDLSGITASISSQTEVSCNGFNDGDVTVIASGSTGPYQYSIDGGTTWQATGLFSALAAGNYTVVSEDANGCQFPVTVLITEPTLLISNVVTSNNTLCFNSCDGNVDISVSGGTSPYVFSWSGPNAFSANTEDLTALCAGTYNLITSDDNLCSSSLSVSIDEPTEIILLTATNSSNCGQSDGSVSVSASGGTISTDYNYSWYLAGVSVGSTASLTNLFAGSYDVIVSDDNSCNISSNQIVSDISGGIATAIEDNMTSCYGLCDGQGTVSINGGSAPFVYLWNSGSTPNQPTNAGLCGGLNTVTVTDHVGCISTATLVINEPDSIYATTSFINETCLGDCQGSINVNGIGGTAPYQYSFDNGITFSNVNSLSSLCASNYNINIKDFNGCSYSLSVEILAGIPFSDATITSFGPLCEDASPATLIAVDAGGVWAGTGVMSNQFDPSIVGAGIYTVSYEISSVCGDTGLIDVTVNSLPNVSFVADVNEGCEPLIVNFLSTGDSSINCIWYFDDGGTSTDCLTTYNNYLYSGTYDVSLTVVDINNCENTFTELAFIDVYSLPVAAFTFSPQPTTIVDPFIYFIDESINANQWDWNFQVSSSSVQNPIVDFENPGTYLISLLVTSIDGCTDFVSDTVLIENQSLVYVPNAFTPNDDGVNEMFLPIFNGIDPVNYYMYIFNRWGELIFDAHHLDIGWDGTCKGVKSPEGVYVYKILARDEINGESHEYVGHVNLIR